MKDEYRGEKGGRPKREKWDEALASAIAGDFENIDPQIQITQFQNLRRLHAEKRTAEDLSSPCGVWIYGPPGTGKSTLARAMPITTPDMTNSLWLEGLQGGEQPPPTVHPYFEKEPNQWWDTYADEPKVILDDLDRESTRSLDRFMKIWCDQYAFKPEIKHGALGKIRPKLFIVTSQFHPQELFDVPTVLALRRRCAIIRTYVEEMVVRMDYTPPDTAVIARPATAAASPAKSVVPSAVLDTFLFPDDFFENQM